MSARCCSPLLLAATCCRRSRVVFARHEHRQLFVELTKLENARDELNIEFGRLQLEQATWAESNRIDQVARDAAGHGVPGSRRHRGGAPMKPRATVQRASRKPRAQAAARSSTLRAARCWLVVVGTLGLCSLALVGRARRPAAGRQRVLSRAGRRALPARSADPDLARHDHRPQRRAAGGVLAGGVGVGQSAGTAEDARPPAGTGAARSACRPTS